MENWLQYDMTNATMQWPWFYWKWVVKNWHQSTMYSLLCVIIATST